MDENVSGDSISGFLDKVAEQVSYKPLRRTIRRELSEHIEDHIEEYKAQGMSPEDAKKRAIADMGDAVSIGVEFNEVHQIRKTPLLVSTAILLLFIGFIYSGWFAWVREERVSEFIYYILYLMIPGLVLFVLVIWKGYAVLIRHRKKLAVLCGALYLAQIALSISSRIYASYRILSPSLVYMALILLGLVNTVLLYQFCKSGWKVITSVCALSGMCFMVIVSLNWFNTASAAAVFLLSTVGTICFMIHRGILAGPKMHLYGAALTGTIFLVCIFMFPSTQKRTVQEFVNPEAAVHDIWDDTYNGVFIQELLGKTPLTHGLKMTREEMMNYGTGKWYFLTEESCWTDRYNNLSVTLWNILPLHFDNNYLIAVTIFQFGWLAGGIFLAVIMVFYFQVFSCIRGIHGKLASSVSFCCGMCLLWQSVFYILGNFGYQYASFTNLPLISEGKGSIVLNLMFLGLIISAYRYDHVMEETHNYLYKFGKTGPSLQ